MILQELIIISLSDNTIQRNYKFKEVGINLILGVKGLENEESNGVGKSDMIDSIRYILGKRIPTQFNNSILKNRDIFITLKVKLEDSDSFFLGRRISDGNDGYILNNKVLSTDIEQWLRYSDTDYSKLVQNFMYKRTLIGDCPSFLSVMEYIIRDEKQGFNDITLPNRNAIKMYRNLSFLCELPYNLEKDIIPLKDTQKEFNKQLTIIKSMDEEILELRVKERKLNKEIRELGKIIKNIDISKKFDVDEIKYKENKEVLNKIQSEIFELEYISKQYKQNIIDLEQKVDKTKLVDGLDEFYMQAIGYFPEQLKKNYEEIKIFYNFMLDNRGKYFKEKIEDIEYRLTELNKEKKQLKKVILETSKILKSTDLVDDINNLSEELTEKNKELAEINIKLDVYNKKSEINKQINELKASILNKNEENEKLFDNYKEQREFLEKTFLNLIDIAYSKEEGVLKFEYENRTALNVATGRIKINCKIADEKSHGRLQMKINIFDLTWFLSRVRNNSDLLMLIHDGSYCKPSSKVKERVLNYVDNELTKYNRGQYFITANIDELTSKTIDDLRNVGGIVAELDREANDKNRFWGFRYQNFKKH